MGSLPDWEFVYIEDTHSIDTWGNGFPWFQKISMHPSGDGGPLSGHGRGSIAYRVPMTGATPTIYGRVRYQGDPGK